jgi:hypothetical protein
MKTHLIVFTALSAGIVTAQSAQTNDAWQTETDRHADEIVVTTKTEKINEVVDDGITYSGIAVAMVNADNELQLLNPVAPEEYGTAEDSVVRDPITGKVSGLKIFSIRF